MCDRVTLLYSRILTEHCKPVIIEKKKIIKKQNKMGNKRNLSQKSLPFSFLLFRAAPGAYGGSQARGRIGAVAASLRHSHSNVRSEPHL